MKNTELAEMLFPDVKDRKYYEEKYKKRDLKEGVITRFAPSPTGFVHLGSLFTSMVARKMAKQTNGVFILRIEDTDQKREVENGVIGIINSLKDFGIEIDEGMSGEDTEIGEYGPYKQSKRKEIYASFAKYLVEKGLAYPCFCTEETLEELRKKQEERKIRPGYYGIWTRCRDLTNEEIKNKIENNIPYVLRLKSMGNEAKKIKYQDLIKGKMEFPENDLDIVLLKQNGIPTYHFAHAVDDYIMGTTHVIRGDEWLASVPVHLQLFEYLDERLPKFAHVAPIMKEEDGAKRKLSKRKDKEAAVSYYNEIGIPVFAVMEYLLNIANPSYENWRRQNPNLSQNDFKLELNKMSVSGALFDMVKLLDISKTIISRYTKEEVYDAVYNWAKVYDEELKEMLANKEYALSIFNIERENIKPRKDIAKWSDVKDSIIYMYCDKFYNTDIKYEFQNIQDINEIKTVLEEYLKVYNDSDDKDNWFNKIKELSGKLGYAKETKEYKENKEMYKGHVGDVSMVLRVALTGRQNTPDMYEIMKILGKDKIEKRFRKVI